MDTNPFRKSSYSSNGGQACVEVASAEGVMVRDSTDRDGGTVTFTSPAWQEFLATVR
jgi:Domain of unknown function (DUF397)